MDDAEVEALADHIAGLALEAQVQVLLGMLERVSDERDRLRAVVRKLFVAAGLALEENGEWLSYASEEYASRHNLTSDEMATCRAALDGSEATDG